MGWRGGGWGQRGPWPGNGPFSNLPPWQRPGWIYGYGRGMRYGRGMGYGFGFNPYICRRFPWLPRGWWAGGMPYSQGGTPYGNYRYGAYGLAPYQYMW